MNITEIITYTLPHTRRREELSICNVFYAILVILIHLLAEPVSQFDKGSVAYLVSSFLWRISSFVVQGYFFMSGTKLFLGGSPVSKKSPPKHRDSAQKVSIFTKIQVHLSPWCRFYGSRLRRVVVPYVVIYCLFALYLTLTGAIEPTITNLVAGFFTGKLCGHFYYVILICQFYLLMPLWQHLVRKSHPAFLLPVAMLVTILCKIYMPSIVELVTKQPFDDNGLLFTSYLFYFIAGAAIGPVYDRFRVFLAEKQKSLVVGWTFLGVTDWLLFWLMSKGVFYLPWLELYHMLYCLYAIPATLSLAAHFRSFPFFQSKLFSTLDRWSYHVYLLHPLFIFLFTSFLNRTGVTSLTLRFLLLLLLVYGTMILFCLLYEKCRKLSFVNLHNSKTK